jgi:hypothetical protein
LGQQPPTGQGSCLFDYAHYFEGEGNVVSDSAFIARGLRAHKNATRKVFAAERQLGIRPDPLIISAIKRKAVLKFRYNGRERTVEPQTYGLSTAGREVLRARECSVANGSKISAMAKLLM